MKLTSQNVQNVFKKCLFKEGENTNNAVMVEGIMSSYGFNPQRLEEKKKNIKDMLSELPEEFSQEVGGGWSFLNACANNKGEQWTGEHRVTEQIFALGMAIGVVQYLTPRETWKVLPGGVPYLVVA